MHSATEDCPKGNRNTVAFLMLHLQMTCYIVLTALCCVTPGMTMTSLIMVVIVIVHILWEYRKLNTYNIMQHDKANLRQTFCLRLPQRY